MPILVDLSNMAHATLHVMKTDVIDPGLFRHALINSLVSIKLKHSARYGNLIIACDGHNYWRRDVFPHYKAHRKGNRDAAPIDFQHFYAVMHDVKKEIKQVFPWKLIEVDKAEADDIIGVVALNATSPTLVHCNDKDFLQLLRNENVSMYKPLVKKWVERMTLLEIEFELFEKIARGDSGDGIPNAINKGDAIVEGTKTGRLTTKSINDWWTNGIPDIYRSRFFENKTLIDLREIPTDVVDNIKKELTEPIIGRNSYILKYLHNNKLNRLAAGLMDDLNRI